MEVPFLLMEHFMKHTVLKIPADLSDHAKALLLATRDSPPADDATLLQRMRDVRYLMQPTLLAFLLNRRKPPTLTDLNTAREELQRKGLADTDRLAA